MQPSANSVTLQHRFTWVALAIIAVSVFVLFAQFGSGGGLLLKGLVLVAALISAAIWWMLFRRSNEYFSAVADAETHRRQREAAAMERTLTDLGQQQAANHVHQLSNKMDDFESVLKMKFGENEVTYQRYMGVGRQLYSGANRNLQAVQASAKSINSIDPAKLEQQLSQLQRSGRGETAEASAIQERYSMYTEQREQIGRLIEQNEEALTALSDATTQLAGIDTNADTSPRLDSMIEDMRRLAERVDQYGVRV